MKAQSRDPGVMYFVDPGVCRLIFVVALDDRIQPYLRTAIPAGDGRFHFINLPAGDYILATLIQEPSGMRAIAHGGTRLGRDQHVKNVSVTRKLAASANGS